MRASRRPSFRLACAIAVVASLATPGSAAAGAGTWTSIGPYGGTVQALAIDPATPTTVYAGTRNGVWKSVDGGRSWAPAVNGLRHVWISALAIDPASPQTVYAGTMEGLYVSTDGATSWQWVPLDPEWNAPHVVAIAVSGSTPGTLYVGANGILRSIDGGAAWTKVRTGQVGDLVVDPTDANTVYASTPDAMVKTSDAGESWTTLPNPEPWSGSLVVDPSEPQTVYSADGQIRKSTDGGATWATLATPPGTTLFHLELAPSSPSTVYAGGRSGGASYMARSDDGGATWTSLARIPGGVLSPIPAVDHRDPSIVYAGTFAHGIYKSVDGGSSFAEVNRGLAAEAANSVAFDPADSHRVYVTLGLGGAFRSTDGGTTWERIAADLVVPGDGTFFSGFTVDASSVVYLSRGADSAAPVFKSTDGGAHWVEASNGLPPRAGRLYADPRTSGTVFAAGSNSLYKTTDGGSTWTAIGPAGAPIGAVAYAPASDTLAVAVGRHDTVEDERFFVSNDWGETWRERAYPEVPVHALAFGSDPDVIYAGSGAGSTAAKSTDGGATWTLTRVDETGNAMDVNALAVDPIDPAIVYAGTHAGGLWISSDAGETWAPLTPGIRGQEVLVVAFPPTASGVEGASFERARARVSPALASQTTAATAAYVGTAGRRRGGVWRVIAAPHNMRRPPLSGYPHPGRLLSCGTGEWSRATSFRFRWLRNGRVISGAVYARYRVRLADKRRYVRCRVTAVGAGGYARAYSRPVFIR